MKIKRKDLLKEAGNAATKKDTWNDRERSTTKTHEFKLKGRRSDSEERLIKIRGQHCNGKKRALNDRERPTTKTNKFKRKGRRSN